ncbi:MAG: ABC transporter ATP-binding protein [Oscillospiraceae bacterium]|nr:ABC transporter ATP-binding protein [Oscillospiraceae bacterium]
MLKISNLETYYGDVRIIKGISLEMQEGKLIAIFGPNGHGKSTLLKTICGLVKPTSGTIEFQGIDVAKLNMMQIVDLGLVYVPEDRHLFPEMTVMENLRMGAYIKRARSKEKQNLEYVFSLFPKLDTLKNRTAGNLSGGEARMLTIGRGLMSGAKLLCIDEPSLGLAPNLRTEVIRKTAEIRNLGVSVILVEQSTIEAAEEADDIYLIENGVVVFSGTPEQAKNNPQFMETFLGVV